MAKYFPCTHGDAGYCKACNEAIERFLSYRALAAERDARAQAERRAAAAATRADALDDALGTARQLLAKIRRTTRSPAILREVDTVLRELLSAGVPRCERAEDLPEVVDASSGRHEWIDLRGIVSCRKCGACRRIDGVEKTCKGVVGASLRAAGEPVCDEPIPYALTEKARRTLGEGAIDGATNKLATSGARSGASCEPSRKGGAE